MADVKQRLVLDEILSEKQIHHILDQAVGDDAPWNYDGGEIKPATDGIAGFLAEHLRATFHVTVKGKKKEVHVFMKSIPTFNAAKAEFIKENQFFTKEHLMFQLMADICKHGSSTWCVKPHLYTESMLVMPDLAVEGYTNRSCIETLDLTHVLCTATSLGRFHGTFVNYETDKSIELKRPYNTYEEFGHLILEGNFVRCPWLTACVKLSVNLLKEFSTKPYRNTPGLMEKLQDLYHRACDELREYKETLNVLVHKDLWVNNIMFKYEDDKPINAVLIDYQTLRYAPPAFDVMVMLYYTTRKEFRDKHEREICDHYYSVFEENLNEDSKKRLRNIGYDKDTFLEWCEKARLFSMILTMALFPFVLMDAKNAAESFTSPDTYDKYLNDDRTEPVLAHAYRCESYKERILLVTEECIEKYLLNQD